ncbi:hypothetical protein BC835DRAFT_383955 [Cytidiella melzeri]|nr:hypothetical protein BC835DRAFT_383955 [Cytidiella melzeri]
MPLGLLWASFCLRSTTLCRPHQRPPISPSHTTANSSHTIPRRPASVSHPAAVFALSSNPPLSSSKPQVMSEEGRSVIQSRRKPPRLLVIRNPDDERDNTVGDEVQPSFSYHSQASVASNQYEEKPQPSRAPYPPPLTTNFPPATLGHYPASRPNPSNQSLSSPSSTSSRAFESTPPPSTPGQSNPPDDMSSEGTLGQDGVLVGCADGSDVTPFSASSKRGYIQRLAPSPKHRRRGSRPQISPVTSVADPLPSTSSSSANESLLHERITLLVTRDSEHLVTVDVYGVKLRDAAYIRERIFSKLKIPDDEQDRQAFYCTEIAGR